jgi:hypothetical protein
MKRLISLLVRRACPKGRISLTPNEVTKMTASIGDLEVNVDLKL